MKYFDTVVWIHRNNAKNDTKNKVAIIAVIIITAAHFLYFPGHSVLGVETNHSISYTTAFLWLQPAPSDSSQVTRESPVNVSHASCWLLLITSKFIPLPPWAGFPAAVTPHVAPKSSVTGSSWDFYRCPLEGDNLTSMALKCGPGVSVISHKLINAAGQMLLMSQTSSAPLRFQINCSYLLARHFL